MQAGCVLQSFVSSGKRLEDERIINHLQNNDDNKNTG